MKDNIGVMTTPHMGSHTAKIDGLYIVIRFIWLILHFVVFCVGYMSCYDKCWLRMIEGDTLGFRCMAKNHDGTH